jgi:hypothetical protein
MDYLQMKKNSLDENFKNMKKIILFSVLLFGHFIYGQTFSTTCDENHIPVSTNHLNPNYSSGNVPLNSQDNFKNGYNWNNTSGFTCDDMQFASVSLVGMTALTSTQTSGGYYSYIYSSASGITRQHLPSEGWELLSVNFGKFPDAQTTDATIKFRSMPFIVLYNRYKSIVRVFVSMGPDKTINEDADAIAVNLRMNFSTSPLRVANGLLRLYDGNDRTLDQPTIIKEAQVVSKAVTAQGDWASADFQVAFDPCVCKYPSELYLEFSHYKSATIKLYGRATTIEDLNIVNPNSLYATPRDFISGFKYQPNSLLDPQNRKGSIDAGLAIEKTISNILNDYESRIKQYQDALKAVNEHNEKVKQNLAVVRFAKAAIAFSVGYGAKISDIATWNALENAGLAFSMQYIANGEASTFDDGNWFKTVNEAYKKIKKNVNNQTSKIDEKELFKILKMVLGEEVDLFITENFELMNAPSVPQAPTNTLSYTEMRFEGEIEVKQNWDGPVFATPGTYGYSIPNTALSGDNIFYYPNYNEPLGVFALLEKPKFIISKTSSTPVSQQWSVVNNLTVPQQYEKFLYQTWVNNFQFQLAAPLKYSFNNVLDIKSKNISVSISLKPKLNQVSTGGITRTYIEPSEVANIESIEIIDGKHEILKNGFSRIASNNNFENGSNYFGKNSNQILSTGSGVPTNYSTKIIDFATPYLDVNVIKGHTFSVGFRNESIKHNTSLQPYQLIEPTFILNPESEGMLFNEFKFEVTLIVDVVYNSVNELGLNNSSTMILKYIINPSDVQSISSNLVYDLYNSSNNITKFEENLDFNNINFDGSPVKGCKLNSSTYTCQAWNDIRVFGDLSTANGYMVNLIAGNQIETFPESVISPEISLSIVPVLDYSQPMPEATPSYVASFCSKQNPAGENYQADTYNKTALDSLVESQNGVNNQTDLAIIKTENELDFQLFPNPSSQLTTVIVEGNESSVTSINILDVMGKEQNLLIEGQNSQFNFDVSSLAKGMYFVKVNTMGASKTKQLIVK